MSKELTHKEMSSRGGKANVKKYGIDKFKKMRQKGIESAKAKYGKAYYQYMYLNQLDTKLRLGRINFDRYQAMRADTLKKIIEIESNPD